MDQKKIIINGKSLYLSDIISNKISINAKLNIFLNQFYSENPFFELSTSGSTGTPKKILLEKKHMIASARKTLKFLKVQPKAKVLQCLPMDKIGGIMVLVRWLEGDLDLYLSDPKSNPLKEWNVVFDLCSMIPYQVSKSLDQLEKVKQLIIGGGAINPELEKDLINLTTEVYHSYGMTETISHIALKQIGESNTFKTMKGVQLELDSNSCLQINAPDIGVYHLLTKDIVDLKSDSEFIWRGRLDNVVNSGGLKFYPEEIEKKIGELETIYFLAGIGDKELGEKLILVTEGQELLDLDFSFLPKYERPKEQILISEFLRTETGKIKRKQTLDSYFKKNQ